MSDFPDVFCDTCCTVSEKVTAAMLRSVLQLSTSESRRHVTPVCYIVLQLGTSLSRCRVVAARCVPLRRGFPQGARRRNLAG